MNITLSDMKRIHINMLRKFDEAFEEIGIDGVKIEVNSLFSRVGWVDGVLYGNRFEMDNSFSSRWGQVPNTKITYNAETTPSQKGRFTRKFKAIVTETAKELFSQMYDNIVDMKKINKVTLSGGVPSPNLLLLSYHDDKLFDILGNGYNVIKSDKVIDLYDFLLTIKSIETVDTPLVSSSDPLDNLVSESRNIVFIDGEPKYELPNNAKVNSRCDVLRIPFVNSLITYTDNVKILTQRLVDLVSPYLSSSRGMSYYSEFSNISKIALDKTFVTHCVYSGRPLFVNKYDTRQLQRIIRLYFNLRDEPLDIIEVEGGYAIKSYARLGELSKKFGLKQKDGVIYFEDEEYNNASYLTPEEKQALEKVNSWSFSPKELKFLNVAEEVNPLYMGVELEVDDGGKDEFNVKTFTSALTGNKPLAYVMHDGSLRNGFEIATMPATLESHMSPKLYHYKRAFNILKDLGYRSGKTSSCGIHVNVNKNFFGDDIAYAVMLIIMEQNWNDFAKFCRRNGNSYAQRREPRRISVNSTQGVRQKCISFIDDRGYGYNKYDAINGSKSYVYELRIFRGTLNPMIYLATLQFVDNFMRIVKNIVERISRNDITFEEITNVTFNDILGYKAYEELMTYVDSLFSNVE